MAMTKEVLSSDSTKALTTAGVGMSSRVGGSSRLPMLSTAARSSPRVLCSMKDRMGCRPVWMASTGCISPARNGSTASVFTCSRVGCMMSRDRKSDRPMSTWLGGACCRPRAWRSSAKTMTKRVNGVMTSSTAGRKVMAVRMSTRRSAAETGMSSVPWIRATAPSPSTSGPTSGAPWPMARLGRASAASSRVQPRVRFMETFMGLPGGAGSEPARLRRCRGCGLPWRCRHRRAR